MRNVRSTRRTWMQVSVLTGLAMLVPAGVSAQAPAAEPPPTTLAADGPSTGVPDTAAAPTQPTAAGLDQLRRALGKGDKVSVTKTNGDTWYGRVVRVGTSDLEIATHAMVGTTGRKKLNLSIPYESIESLERPRDSSQNGGLIGAGVGAAVGLSMFAYLYAVDANEADEWGSGVALFTVLTTGVGALTGWAIDAVHSKPHLVYQADRGRATQVSVAPIVGRGKGAAVVVRF